MKSKLSNPYRFGAIVLATAFLLGATLPARACDVTSTSAINVDAGGASVAGSADFTAKVDGANANWPDNSDNTPASLQ